MRALLPAATEYELGALYEYVDNYGSDDPALTQAIVQVSKFVTRYGLFIAIFAIAAFVLLRRAAQSHRGRRIMEKLLLRNRIFLDRTVGIGTLTAADAVAWSMSGPCRKP